jgi:hypothetical protein
MKSTSVVSFKEKNLLNHTQVVFQLVKHVLNVKIEEGVQLKHQSEEVHECNLLVFLGLVRGPKVLKIK